MCRRRGFGTDGMVGAASGAVSADVGLRGLATMRVSDTETARSLVSGSVDVLATPRLVALCEQATCVALDEHLAPGCTTVGIWVQIDHQQPTPVGSVVEAEAVLETVEGRRLTLPCLPSTPRASLQPAA